MKIGIADIEANGFRTLILSKNKEPKGRIADRIHCIAVKTLGEDDGVLYGPGELVEGLARLNQYDVIVGHNFWDYDKPLIEKFIGKMSAKIHDTLIFSRMLFPDKYDMPVASHSLESWGKFTGQPKFNYTLGFDEYNETMGEYCLKDILANEAIYLKQLKLIDNDRLPSASIQLEHLVAEVGSYEIKENGFCFDAAKVPEVAGKLEAEAAEILFNLKKTFPDEVTPQFHKTTKKPKKPKVVEFVPRSGKSCDYYFKKYLKWDFDLNPKTNNPVCDKEAMNMCPHEEANLVLAYRERATMLSYLKDWTARTENTNYIYHTLNGVGTQTGRASHNEPNLGQVSKASYARTLFLPHPGEVLVGSDLSGLELRMLAHYLAEHGNADYADIVINGDVHWHNALLAGIAKDDVFDPTNTTHKQQRNQAKTFIYGWLYGAGAAKLGRIVGGTARDGTKLRNQFLSSIVGLKPLKDDLTNQVARNRGVRLVDGRTVPVRSQHAALNTLLQGSGAMVCKVWLVDVYKRKLEQLPEAKILGWIHDEIQSSCPADRAEDLGKLKVACAQDVTRRLKLLVDIDAEYDVGENWKDTH